MRVTLVLAILKIQSSYKDETEKPVGEGDIPDTVQWYIADGKAWRIRTYALDHDIHIYAIKSVPDEVVDLAIKSNAKHYSDVMQNHFRLDFDESASEEETQEYLESIGLSGFLEFVKEGYYFWKPDEGHYFSQSKPTE
jgi:hypothetical protein